MEHDSVRTQKNKRKGRVDPGVCSPEEFHSNICIGRVELEICVNHTLLPNAGEWCISILRATLQSAIDLYSK